MGSATINLSAVIDSFGGTTPAPLRFTAQVMRGGQPGLRVDGAQAVLPAPLVWYWSGTAWAPSVPVLTDVDLDCYWLIELSSADGTTRLTRTVVLPAGHGTNVDFGALAIIDPATLVPTSTVLQTWLTQVVLLPPAGTAVGDVPVVQGDGTVAWTPQSGGGAGNDPAFQYTQASASAQWTIAHSFGRRPDVDVYLTTGEHVITDVTASPTQVVVTFPTPTAGYAVLT